MIKWIKELNEHENKWTEWKMNEGLRMTKRSWMNQMNQKEDEWKWMKLNESNGIWMNPKYLNEYKWI